MTMNSRSLLLPAARPGGRQAARSLTGSVLPSRPFPAGRARSGSVALWACCWLALVWLGSWAEVSAQVVAFLGTSVEVGEGDGTVALIVTRVPATGIATVHYSTRDGSAAAPGSYVATSGDLHFAAGEAFQIITVAIVDNTLQEMNNDFFVDLSNPIGATLGAATNRITIIDNDSAFRLNLAGYVVNEGVRSFSVDVVRTGNLIGDASVNYTTADGTAFAGADYASLSGVLTFTNGQATNQFGVSIIDDCFPEQDATFEVQIFNPVNGVMAMPTNAIVIIQDDDSPNGTLGFDPLLMSPMDLFPFEGRTIRIPVERTCAYRGAVSVRYRPINDSICPGSTNAHENFDYTGARGTLNWADNQRGVQYINLVILQDDFVELHESIVLELDNPTGGADISEAGSRLVISIMYEDQAAGAGDLYYNFAIQTDPNANPGANNTVQTIALDGSGRAVIAGDFTGFNGVVRNRLARLDSLGALDPTFDPGTGADGTVLALAVQPDGQVLAGGLFTSINNQSRVGLARLNSDGSLDDSFSVGAGVDGYVQKLALQPDGRILIAGEFSAYDNIPCNRLARLSPDGRVDFTFDSLGPDGTIYAFQLQPDGRVLIGGAFTHIGATPVPYLARLNADGSLDSSFRPVFGPDGPVLTLALQADGYLLAGGLFQTYDGESRPGVARLQPDGTLDPTFQPGAGVLGSVWDIKVQPDGLPILAGDFVAYNQTPRHAIARLNPDGTLDTRFLDAYYNLMPGPDGFILSTAIQNDGNILIAGSFSYLGSGITPVVAGVGTVIGYPPLILRNNMARLIGGDNPPVNNAPGNVEFAATSVTVDEGTYSGFVKVPIQRLNGTLGALSVDYRVIDGSAKAGRDFVVTNGTLVWGDCFGGITNIYIPILDNQLPEGNRTFYVVLTNVYSPALVGAPSQGFPSMGFHTVAAVTIIDDDFSHGVLGFSAPVFAVAESNTAVISVVRTNGLNGDVTVQYSVLPGSATAVSDYTPRSGVLDFPSGVASNGFLIPIFNDTLAEFEETVRLVLASPAGGATLGLSNATLLIFDNDGGKGSVSLSQTAYAVGESAGAALINVRRSSGSAGAVTAAVTTVEFTTPDAARAGIDYQHVTTNFVFASGETNKILVVPILSDALVEGPERFGVSVTNVTGGANIGFISNTVVTITDDDFYGQLAFSDARYYVNEMAGSFVVTVTRTAGSGDTVKVRCFTLPGSAVEGRNFTGLTNTLVFAPGVLTRTFTIPLLHDPELQGARTVFLGLDQFDKATPGLTTNALLTIFDQESLNIPAGGLDSSFSPQPGANDFVQALGLQTDGKLVVGGRFTRFNGVAINRLARLYADGAVDPFFRTGTGLDDTLETLWVQPDDRILIGGRFTSYNGLNRRSIARLGADGSLDTSFNPGAGFDNPVHALALLSDGRILAGGSFVTFNGVSQAGVALLTANGGADLNFNPGTGPNGTVYAVAVQADGKFLVGGEFTRFNATNRVGLVRLNPSGSIDPSFDAALLGGGVRSIVIQPDGAIVVGGSFTNAGGVACGGLVRLGSNGAADGGFLAAAAGARGSVLAVVRQADGKLVVAGDFARFNGLNRSGITRLNADGSSDATINFGAGANGFVSAVALQNDGRIVIGGAFTQFDGVPRAYVARLMGGANAGAGSFEFEAPVYTVGEWQNTVTCVLRRVGGTGGSVTVRFATEDGTATSGQDYAGQTNLIVFADGEAVKSVTLTIYDDTLVEETETVRLTLSDPGAGTLWAEAILNLLSEDTSIGFQVADFVVNENVAGGQAVIRVVRTGGTDGVVKVDYGTEGGSALPASDYLPVAGQLIFQPGQSVKYFLVPILNDNLVEGNETVGLVLSNVTAPGVLGRDRATLTIVDDDSNPGVVTLTASDYVVDESVGSLAVTVVRTNGSTGPVSVTLATANGTATNGVDYLGLTNVLTFQDGVTSRIVSIAILSNTVPDGDRSFTVRLFDPAGITQLGLTGASVTIQDDDSAVAFEAADYSVSETNGSVVLSILRQGATNRVAAVTVVSRDGSAFAGEDYGLINTQLVFQVGQTVATLTVPIRDDLFIEGDEDFFVSLTNPVLGNVSFTPVSRQVAQVVIRDNDLPGGSVDPTFGAAVDRPIYALGFQPDGQILIGGDFTQVNGVSNVNRLARLRPDGTLDPNFVVGRGPNSTVLALAVDGPRLSVAGTFTNFNGLAWSHLARLSDTGALDSGYQANGLNNTVHALYQYPDGRLLLGGNFTFLNGQTRNFVARLNTNGVLETAFNNILGPNGAVRALAVQADGKILLGGDFTTFNGQSRSHLVRLNADGTPDAAFSWTNVLNGPVYALALQTNGNVLLAGDFTALNGAPCGRLLQLRANGSVDSAFNLGLGANNYIRVMTVQPDGRILLGGGFTTFNGVPHRRIVRLTPAGLVDTTINFGDGADDFVNVIAVLSDGRMLVAGGFNRFHGVACHGLARLEGGLLLDPGAIAFDAADYWVNENGTNVVLNVVRAGGLSGTAAVKYETADGSAYEVQDYTGQSGSLYFAEGEAVKTITVALRDNVVADGDRTFTVALTSVDGTAALVNPSVATVTIVDNEALVGFTASSYAVNEGFSVTIPVVRQGGTNDSVTVHYSVMGSSATAGVDFITTNGVLNFLPGQLTNSLTIVTLNDLTIESNETFTVVLYGASAPTQLGQSVATVTVLDRNFAPGAITFRDINYYAPERSGQGLVTLRRSAGLSGSVSATVISVGGTALVGVDYQPVSLPVSFADGEREKQVAIPLLGDAASNRTIRLALINPTGGAVLGSPAEATLTILDSDTFAGQLDEGFNYFQGANGAVRAVAFDVQERLYVGGDFTFMHGLNMNRIVRLSTNGCVDRTFDPGTGANGSVYALDRTTNGLVIGGAFTEVNGQAHGRVARLLASGTVDPTFNSAGPGPDGTVEAVAVQPDQRVLIGGSFTTFNGQPAIRLARLAADGSFDPTFNVGQGADAAVTSVTIQPNGQILVGGQFTTFNGRFFSRLVRLNPDGTFDPSFSPGLGPDGAVRAVTAQPDGQIVIGGDFLTVNGAPRARLARLQPDGSVDLSFDPGLGANDSVLSLALQSNGKLVVAGAFTQFNGNALAHLGRLNPNGTVDTAFTVGSGVNGPIHSIALANVSAVLTVDRIAEGDLLEDRNVVETGSVFGRILIKYDFRDIPDDLRIYYDGRLIYELNTLLAGDFEVPYGPGTSTVVTVVMNEGIGEFGTYWEYSMTVVTGAKVDNRLAIGGDFTSVNSQPVGRVAVLNSSGSVYDTFQPGGGLHRVAYALGLYTNTAQPDLFGKVIVGGDFTAMAGVDQQRYVGRLNADGSFDASFETGVGANGPVRAVLVEPDGKVVLGGLFTTVNQASRFRLARLNADGQVDSAFNPGPGLNGGVYALALQPDGRLLVGGDFTSAYGASRGRMARMNATGTLDVSFDPGTGADGTVRALALQADGKVLLGGTFTNVNSRRCDHLARLNPDGSLDAGFNPSNGLNGPLEVVVVQPDGGILIGGAFTQVWGVPAYHLARLNADGSLDGTFTPGTGADDLVQTIVLQPDGKLVVGGAFISFGGQMRNRLVRLNANGSLDATVNFGTGADNFISAAVVQPDGNLLVGGAFTEFDGRQRWAVARLMGGVTTSPGQFRLSAPAYTVNEDGTNLLVTVLRARGAVGEASVRLRTQDDSALHDVHYSPVNQNLLFNDAETFKIVSIPILDNPALNPDRRFAVLLTDALGGDLGSPSAAGVTIQDNDCTLGFSAPVFTILEGATAARVTVTRQGSSLRQVTVDCATTTNGTATAGLDYLPVAATLVFAPGVSEQSLDVPILNDALPEFDETVGLVLTRLSGGAAAGLTNATLTIGDNNPAPGELAFSTNSAAVLENVGRAVLTVTRAAGHAGTVWVEFTTANGGAYAGVDYVGTNGVLVFAEGETTKTIAVGIRNDSRYQGDRSLYIRLSNLGGGAVAGAYTDLQLTIVDDEQPPSFFSFTTNSFVLNEADNVAFITVLRASNTASTVSVGFYTTNETALDGFDYLGTNGVLTFTNGEVLQSFTVPILDDLAVQSNHTFRIGLVQSGPNSLLVTPSNAVVTIVDNDVSLGFTTNSFSVSEGGSYAVVTLRRLGLANSTVQVDYAVLPGTATAGADFVPTNGTLVFAPGQTLQSFLVPILDDQLQEFPETILLALSNVTSGATLFRDSAVLTIVDNDVFHGVIGFGAPAFTVKEAGTNAVVSVVRTNGSTGFVSVRYTTLSGTATENGDYMGQSGVVAFLEGETFKTISIPITNDLAVEGNEDFYVQLSNPTGGATLADPATVPVTIVDDESGPGTADRDFNPGAGADNFVRALLVQADGKIVIAGAFTNFDLVRQPYVARLNPWGSLDTNFMVGSGPSATVSALALSPEGKILLGGTFTNVSGVTSLRVARLATNGPVDLSFSQPGVLDAAVNALAVQADNKVVVGGGFAQPASSLARLRGNASVDITFNPGSGADGPVHALVLLSNGQILVAGSFATFDGFSRSRVARIQANGNIDSTFVPPLIATGAVYTAVLQPDGKALLGGDFTTADGLPCNRFLRLNADGSLDLTFAGARGASLGANGVVYALAVQADGKIVIGGNFTSINGVARTRLARLNSDGSLDSTFDPGRGANGPVYALAVLPDGSVIIGGDFTAVNGYPRRGVARLNGDENSLKLARVSLQAGHCTLSVRGAPGRNFVLLGSTDLRTWLPVSTNVATGWVTEIADPAAVGARRFYRVRLISP